MKASPRALGFVADGGLSLCDKQCRMVIVADIKVLSNPGKRRVGKVDFAWLIAFANDLGRLRFPIDLRPI
jgi:hypothetical protein